MAIEQVQPTQPVAAGPIAPARAPQPAPQQAPSRLAQRDEFRPHREPLPSPPPFYHDPFPRRDPFCNPWSFDYPFCRTYPFPEPPPAGGGQPVELHGAVSANLQVYFNTRTHEPQLLPVVKGQLELAKIGKEGAISAGLSMGANGLTRVITPAVVGTVIDRDYDGDQHMKLDVEVGYSSIRDEESWDRSNKASYGALRVGAMFAPHKNINLTAGADVSGTAINPYIGLGGRWSF